MPTYPVTTSYGLTGDYRIDSLLAVTTNDKNNPIMANKWGAGTGEGAAVSFSFHTPGVSIYPNNYGDLSYDYNTTAPNSVVKTAVRSALSQWTKVANISATEVADTGATKGDMQIGVSGYADLAFIYAPGVGNSPNSTGERGGDVWLASSIYANATTLLFGSAAMADIERYIGTALGLNNRVVNRGGLSSVENSQKYSIMSTVVDPSWFQVVNGKVEKVAPTGPQLYDILAIQHLYGANTTTATGSDVYKYDPASLRVETLWDAGGTDTIDASAFTSGVRVNLTPGSFSTISEKYAGGGFATTLTGEKVFQATDNVAIAYGTIIENATGGAGDDVIIGNDANNVLRGGAGHDTILGGLGDDTLSGGQGNDNLDGGAGIDFVDYTDSASSVTVDLNAGVAVGNDSGYDALVSIEGVLGTIYGDTVIDGAGDKHIYTGNGDDVIHVLGGNDVINGGSGKDTAIWSGFRQDHGVTFTGGGSAEVSSSAGFALLSEVETLKFRDGTFTTDVASNAAKVARIYDTVLDREADLGGLRAWTGALDGGNYTLKQVAEGFMKSAEFTSKYGTLDNTAFVKQLYVNVLGRDGEKSGVDAWVGGLKSGNVSRADVVTGFSESAENVLRSKPLVEKGLWITSDHAGQVARLYDTTLDRAPDQTGLDAWIGGLDSGNLNLKDLAKGFMESVEFKGKYGALNDQAFVEQMYLNVVDRPGEKTGIDAWVGGLKSGGIDRADVVVGFSESAEHQVKMAGLIDDGIHFNWS